MKLADCADKDGIESNEDDDLDKAEKIVLLKARLAAADLDPPHRPRGGSVASSSSLGDPESSRGIFIEEEIIVDISSDQEEEEMMIDSSADSPVSDFVLEEERLMASMMASPSSKASQGRKKKSKDSEDHSPLMTFVDETLKEDGDGEAISYSNPSDKDWASEVKIVKISSVNVEEEKEEEKPSLRRKRGRPKGSKNPPKAKKSKSGRPMWEEILITEEEAKKIKLEEEESKEKKKGRRPRDPTVPVRYVNGKKSYYIPSGRPRGRPKKPDSERKKTPAVKTEQKAKVEGAKGQGRGRGTKGRPKGTGFPKG